MSQVFKMTNTRQGVTVSIAEEFRKTIVGDKPYYKIFASDETGKSLVYEGGISFKRAVEVATSYGTEGGWEE